MHSFWAFFSFFFFFFSGSSILPMFLDAQHPIMEQGVLGGEAVESGLQLFAFITIDTP